MAEFLEEIKVNLRFGLLLGLRIKTREQNLDVCTLQVIWFWVLSI